MNSPILFNGIIKPILNSISQVSIDKPLSFNWIIVNKEFYNYYKSDEFQNLMKIKREEEWKRILLLDNKKQQQNQISYLLNLVINHKHLYLFRHFLKDEIILRLIKEKSKNGSEVMSEKQWIDHLSNLMNKQRFKPTLCPYIVDILTTNKWRYIMYTPQIQLKDKWLRFYLNPKTTKDYDLRWIVEIHSIKEIKTLPKEILKIHLKNAIKKENIEYFLFVIKYIEYPESITSQIIKEYEVIPFETTTHMVENQYNISLNSIIKHFINLVNDKKSKIDLETLFEYCQNWIKSYIPIGSKYLCLVIEYLNLWPIEFHYRIKSEYLLEYCHKILLIESNNLWFYNFIQDHNAQKDSDNKFLDLLIENMKKWQKQDKIDLYSIIKKVEILKKRNDMERCILNGNLIV